LRFSRTTKTDMCSPRYLHK